MVDLYHVLNRGVDKRTIFLDNQDYFRFIHDLFVFNDDRQINSTSYHFYNASPATSITTHSLNKTDDLTDDLVSRKARNQRNLLVNIHFFCLMPNHYHLLLSPRKEGGITKFMRKLNMGYAKYFNERNKRSGALFEGRYKSILVKHERHFLYLPFYIHFNPLDLYDPLWRKGVLKSKASARQYLESYRWSSHLDYTGHPNFPSVTQRELFLDFFGREKGYTQTFKKYLGDYDTEEVRAVALE